MSCIVFRLPAVVLAASLAACSHMPVSTMWALRNFDASTVDAPTLRAAVRLPEAFEPRRGGVTLTVGWWRDGEDKHEAKFVLKETTASDDLAPLAGERKPGTRLFAYRVDPADYAAIGARQKEFLEEKARNPAKTHGSFGVGADACRRGELPDGPILTTSFLRTQSGGPYLTLLKNVDLREAATQEKPLEELLPLCGKFDARAEPSVAG
ncbi:hypothetical protein [Methylocystis sp. ATCC 49242]|uniref:hypothetical protein n=1 Tax=Methylocystis sp. ATCC 49242 TaxID=622637 RepID=UPI0001F86B0C|nr:hypothetical protein [Methylocystis sp. ATCC 49242]